MVGMANNNTQSWDTKTSLKAVNYNVESMGNEIDESNQEAEIELGGSHDEISNEIVETKGQANFWIKINLSIKVDRTLRKFKKLNKRKRRLN